MTKSSQENLLYPPRAGSELDVIAADILSKPPEYQLNPQEVENIRVFEGALMDTNIGIIFQALEATTTSKQGLDKLETLLESSASGERRINLETIAKLPDTTCNVYLADFVDEQTKDKPLLNQRQAVTKQFLSAKQSPNKVEISELIKNANQSMRQLESDICAAVFNAVEAGNNTYNGPENNSVITVVYDPATLTHKVESLNALKSVYKKALAAVAQIHESGPTKQDIDSPNMLGCMAFLIELYLKRTNVELAAIYSEVGALFEQTYFASDVDINEQLPYLKKLSKLVPGMRMDDDATVHVVDDDTRLWSNEHLDKFLHGAETATIDERGNFGVINKNLEGRVGEAHENESHSEPTKDFMGFTPEQYKDVVFNAEDFAALSRLTLKAYGILSETQNYDENNPETKNTPAEDGLVRVAVVNGQSNASYDFIPKVFKIGKILERTLASLKPTTGLLPLLDHETVHVIQNYNKEHLGLRIFDLIGSDRRIVMAEAGALSEEKETYEEEFGIIQPKTHQYLASMSSKLRGEGMFGMLSAFYKEATARSLAEARSKDDKDLKIAVNRVMRQFRLPGTMHNNFEHGHSSQSLVYSEEITLPPLLQGESKKYLLVGGANLDTLAKLHDFGLLPEELLLPDKKPSQLPEVREYISQKIARSSRDRDAKA